MKDTPGGAANGSRYDRRREATRSRLLSALRGLLLSRGVGDFTIEEITEAADVGKGTFYHHFDSKEDALQTIATAHVIEQSQAIKRLASTIEDPAEVIAVAFRHTLRQLTQDPIYRWFVLSSEMPRDKLNEVVGAGGRRDIERGVAEGRFRTPFSPTLFHFLLGGGIAVAAGHLEGTMTDPDLDAATAYVLCCLGIDPEEASEITSRPLPELKQATTGVVV